MTDRHLTTSDLGDDLVKRLRRVVAQDPGSAYDAALEMLEDPDAAQRMASEGQRTIHSRFKWEDMAEAYERLFLRAVAGRVNAPSGTGGQ